MENYLKAKVAYSQKSDELHLEIQPKRIGEKLKKSDGTHETEKVLNYRILHVTMTISHKYPELSKYLDEIPVTIPVNKFPEITLKDLRAYHESLRAIMSKYILEHPLASK
jgi:hypothetical protein